METTERERAIAALHDPPARLALVSIDALRAFAAVWVVLFHANFVFWQSAERELAADPIVRLSYQTLGLGWLGVPLFFVISGFCIHLPYARGARFDLREYVVRRAVRIWPPFAAAIVAGLLFQLAKGNGAPSLFAHFAANLAFLFPGRGPIGGDNIVFWSIVVEVQLYAIYLLIRTAGPSSRALVGWTIAFLVFGVAYHLAVEYWPLPEAIARVAKPRFLAPARMGEWLLGAVVADRLVHRPASRDRPIVDRLLIVGGVALIAASLAVTRASGLEEYALEPFASGGFALILAGLVRAERRRPARRAWQWVAHVGHRSYSLYLFHFLALSVTGYVATRFVLTPDGLPLAGSGRWLVTVCCGVALGFVAAELCYRLVERPSHRLARQWGQRAARGWR